MRLADIEDRTHHKGGVENLEWLEPASAKSIESSSVPTDYCVLTIALTQATRSMGVLDFPLKSVRKAYQFNLKALKDLGDNFSAQHLSLETPRTLREDAESWAIYIEHLFDELKYSQLRSRTQETIVFSLIAQTDNMRNIELAKDSKSLAAASKRDSSAIKTIAVLTTVFLPGTFISTFVSMPLLSWNASSWSTIVTSRFWVYWAITIPLTLVTLIAWYSWRRWRDARSEEEDRAVRKSVGAETFGVGATEEGMRERKLSARAAMLVNGIVALDLRLWSTLWAVLGRRQSDAKGGDEEAPEDLQTVRVST